MLCTVWSGSKAISTLNMNPRQLKKESRLLPGQQAETFVSKISAHATHASVITCFEANSLLNYPLDFAQTGPRVLHDLSFRIASGERVGVGAYHRLLGFAVVEY